MRNRLSRLDTIYTYILSHPYSTCAQIASHLSRRVGLIQTDVRTLYRSGWLDRRKARYRLPQASDNSTPQRFLHLGYEYYVAHPDRKSIVASHQT